MKIRTSRPLMSITSLVLVSISSAQVVALQKATATFSQSYSGTYDATKMIDGITTSGNGWAIYNNGATDPQVAAFQTVTDLTSSQVRISMLFNHTEQHLLGRFRLSATSDNRSTFCDGLQNGGNVIANWTVLNATSISLSPGLTSTIMGDGSILIGGVIPSTGIYNIQYNLPIVNTTGFRLEAMADPSLPTNGPGLASNGNFVVTEFTATAAPEPGAFLILALGLPVLLRRRSATK